MSNKKQDVIELDTNDLPLYCPMAKTPRWNYHPRVFLEISSEGHVDCPYCGTHYQLKENIEAHEH